MTDNTAVSATRRELLQQTIDGGFRLLRFPAALEPDFLAAYQRGSVAMVRRILPWLSVIYVATCTLMILGTRFEDIIPWVWNVLVPIGCALSYLWIALYVPALAQGVHWHAGIAVTVSLVCTVRAVFLFQDTSLVYYIPFHVVYVLIILFSVVRLRLMAASAWALLAATVSLAMAGLQQIPVDLLAFSQYFLITAFLAGIVGYAIEYRERADYLKSELLRLEKTELAELKGRADAELERQRLHAEYMQAISGHHDADELARRTLAALAQMTSTPVGLVYLVEDGSIRLAARRGLSVEMQRIPERLQSNETLVGQALAGRRTLRLRELPPGFMRIETGLLDLVPAELLVLPAIHDGQVLAVIELALPEPLSADRLALVERIAPAFAAALITARVRHREPA